jgi:hypothetical protein
MPIIENGEVGWCCLSNQKEFGWLAKIEQKIS